MRDSKLHCHRAIIIQTTLRELGSLIWLEIDHRLTRGELDTWLAQADISGVMAWPVLGSNLATTALTHPKMFNYFDKRKYEDYAFQHMVSLGTAIIFTSERIQSQLMLPWLQCVLTEVSRINLDFTSSNDFSHASTLSALKTPDVDLIRSQCSDTVAVTAMTCPPSTSSWVRCSASRSRPTWGASPFSARWISTPEMGWLCPQTHPAAQEPPALRRV